jgi:predicted HD phosphohydrolase
VILTTVEALVDQLASGEGVSDGEAVDLLDHMLQCAALLKERAPDDPELQVAGLVHDLGWQLTHDPATHATVGANAVARLLGDRIAALVAGHDQAKRYLVTTEGEYRARLSETSVLTLAFQGGDMEDAERRAFERGEHFEALVALRRADDAAKVPGHVVPRLAAWRTTLDQLAATSSPF